MNPTGLAGLGLVLLATMIMVFFAILDRRFHFSFRNIRAYTHIQRAARLVVEDGTRLHFSLGNASMLAADGASALTGLVLLRRLGEFTSLGDLPPIVTTGSGLLNLLAQDTMREAHDAVVVEQPFDMNNARLTGFTPFSYAAGVMSVIRNEKISTNVLFGSFGPEVGLLTDAADRQHATVIAASEGLTAQAVLFASSSSDVLIGEELFAAGAYIQAGPFHTASLLLQDILRWLVILALLAGAGMKLLGVL
ncbi:MAG: hypothetical protein NTW32_07825 [Chloroflexi bacterium]|nr:hypothetical protein [Chloroflexota bacterium]